MAFEVLASGERASEVDVKIELYRMNRCWYCGLPLKRHCSRRDPRLRTEDHQIPKSKGGEDKPYNKVLACRKCNEEKGKRNVQQYREFLGVDEFWGEKFAKEIRRKLDGAI
jgi:5-methylcytosine-specific restriction endonuclease McrA